MSKSKKFTLIDYVNLAILTIIFFLIVFLILKKGYILGSTVDWSSQHIAFPEYFRTLFLETKDLFPDFSFNLGAGQNIYNFAYYGLLSPIILISYLFPKINMVTYIIVSSCFFILLSALLFYKLLRNHCYNSYLSLIVSIIFMCASPLIFHMHRHIMFVNYMPFLILGFFGVDKYFEKDKSWLLIISIFLMIMTSYYYSVVGIIVLTIYGVYTYIKKTPQINIKGFFLDGSKFAFRIIIGILLASILIVPTFLVILNGREATTVSISLKEVITPGINLDYILYKYYGIGLGAITIFALINSLTKKRENRFLGITLILVILFPFINYLFNATMYIDAKSLIPFLPLYVLLIASFLKDIYEDNTKLKWIIPISIIILILGKNTLGSLDKALYIDIIIVLGGLFLYRITHLKCLLGISLVVISCCITILSSRFDSLVERDLLYGKDYHNQKNIIEDITNNDFGLYRISNQITPLENTNRIYNNINYYKNTLYSSTYNKIYNKFYYDIMNNPIQSRNRVITSSAKNYPFLLLMGNKYLVTDKNPYLGYTLYKTTDNINVYKNDSVLPLAYARSDTMSEAQFTELGYPYNQEAILKNIIINKDDSKDFSPSILKKDLELDLKPLKELNIETKNDITTINIEKDQKIKLKLKEKLHNKLLYIHFDLLEDNPCSIGDSIIRINGITNKLTCNPWKYHNKNFTFDYVLSEENIRQLTVFFSKGIYKIKNVEYYILDYEDIKNIREDIDEFLIDKEKTKGDNIEGNISVKKDGYFTMSIPYDQGFTATVDGEKIPVEKVNMGMIGFPIKKGNHHIKIEYKAPGKKIGLILSTMGILLTLGAIVYEERRGKKND